MQTQIVPLAFTLLTWLATTLGRGVKFLMHLSPRMIAITLLLPPLLLPSRMIAFIGTLDANASAT